MKITFGTWNGLGLCELIYHAGTACVPAYKFWWDILASNLAMASLLGRSGERGVIPTWRPEAGRWCVVPNLGEQRLAQLLHEHDGMWEVRISRGAWGTTDHWVLADDISPPPAGWR